MIASPPFFLIANASVTTFLMSFPKGPWGPLPIRAGLDRSLLRGGREDSAPSFPPVSSPPPSQTPLRGQVVRREGKTAISQRSASWRAPPAITANNDKKTGLLPEIESWAPSVTAMSQPWDCCWLLLERNFLTTGRVIGRSHWLH